MGLIMQLDINKFRHSQLFNLLSSLAHCYSRHYFCYFCSYNKLICVLAYVAFVEFMLVYASSIAY